MICEELWIIGYILERVFLWLNRFYVEFLHLYFLRLYLIQYRCLFIKSLLCQEWESLTLIFFQIGQFIQRLSRNRHAPLFEIVP